MDKIDKLIKNASEHYEPRADFVDATMKQISQQQPIRRWYMQRWVPAFAGLAAVVLIVGVVAWPKNQTSNVVGKTPGASVAQTTTSPSASPEPIAAETVDTQIETIQAALDQAGSDQTNADVAVNDASQQITIPTD